MGYGHSLHLRRRIIDAVTAGVSAREATLVRTNLALYSSRSGQYHKTE